MRAAAGAEPGRQPSLTELTGSGPARPACPSSAPLPAAGSPCRSTYAPTPAAISPSVPPAPRRVPPEAGGRGRQRRAGRGGPAPPRRGGAGHVDRRRPRPAPSSGGGGGGARAGVAPGALFGAPRRQDNRPRRGASAMVSLRPGPARPAAAAAAAAAARC